MSDQTERPGITREQLLVDLGLPSDTKVKLGGGKFENFRRGWGRDIMRNQSSSHWFERDGFDGAFSLCGVVASIRWLYGPGDHEKCSNCIRIMSRRRKSGVAQ